MLDAYLDALDARFAAVGSPSKVHRKRTSEAAALRGDVHPSLLVIFVVGFGDKEDTDKIYKILGPRCELVWPGGAWPKGVS